MVHGHSFALLLDSLDFLAKLVQLLFVVLPFKNVHVGDHLLHLGLDGLLGFSGDESKDFDTFLGLTQVKVDLSGSGFYSLHDCSFWRLSDFSLHQLRNNAQISKTERWLGQ